MISFRALELVNFIALGQFLQFIAPLGDTKEPRLLQLLKMFSGREHAGEWWLHAPKLLNSLIF